MDSILQKMLHNPIGRVVGISRSLLALGTFCTLLFNETEVLFPRHIFETLYKSSSWNYFLLFDWQYLDIARYLACFVLLFVILGTFPRWFAIPHWWISWSFFNASGMVDGGDQITAIATALFAPIFLLDARNSHFSTKEVYSENPYKNFWAWSWIMVLQLQVAILYLQAGVEKLYKNADWLNGTAIYYWFNNNTFGVSEWIQPFINGILQYPICISILNWGVIGFELILASALFMTAKLRNMLLPFALVFHGLIWAIHGLFSFCVAMWAVLLIYLFNPASQHFPQEKP
jgi:antimicrobial peptide system SdpB family protein